MHHRATEANDTMGFLVDSSFLKVYYVGEFTLRGSDSEYA
jgi:hypothetical protein